VNCGGLPHDNCVNGSPSRRAGTFLDSPGDDTPLTGADRVYLVALERILDMYSEMRMAEV